MSKLRVYQSQDFETTCRCLEYGFPEFQEEYFDTYVYCPEHGQWWLKGNPDHYGCTWVRCSAKEVPYIIRHSQKYREIDANAE